MNLDGVHRIPMGRGPFVPIFKFASYPGLVEEVEVGEVLPAPDRESAAERGGDIFVTPRGSPSNSGSIQ